jgi:helix-turn-helix protein
MFNNQSTGLFHIFNMKTGQQTMISAFDMNAARRKAKKMLGFTNTRLPKRILVLPVTKSELENMFQAQMEAQAKAQQEAQGTEEVPLVDPLNGFKTIEQVADAVESLEARAEEIKEEVQALKAETEA